MNPLIGNQEWISSYGITLVIALVACWWLARRNAREIGLDPSHIDLLLPAAVVAGIVFTVLLPEPHLQLIPLIALCLAVVFIYARLTRQPFARLTDALALPTIAAIAIQRIGCFLAGCCWGDPVSADSLQWLGVEFPAGSFAYEQHVTFGLIGPEAAASLPVHATQLYEAALLVTLLVAFPRRVAWWLAPGTLTMLAITGYALIRFGVEFLRADNIAVFGSITGVQALCLGLFVAGALQARRMSLYS